jgi:16S rRNA (cytosine1402-N4)-methyltransferase
MAGEVVDLFRPVPPGVIVDCTVGGGGHAALLLEARPDCRLIGVDRDAQAITAARAHLARFGDRVELVHQEFGRLGGVVAGRGEAIVGILMDLGVSSPQLDRPERGFSYRYDVPLDMRMDARQSLTASTVVNEYSEQDLAGVIFRFGEERHARRVARAIVAARPINGTGQLVDIVAAAMPAQSRRTGGHPARRTFQAIRMEVNAELANLSDGLDDAVRVLDPEGRLVVLSYHSLEDRMVKEHMRDWADEDAAEAHVVAKMPVERTRNPLVRVLTRRAMKPTADEVAANPRAESARLRAAEKLGRRS